MKKITIIWLFLSIPFLSVSQKVFVPWTVIISDTQSYQDALEIGLNDAKEQALREAGVTEKIHSYTLNAVFEDGENFEEVFNSEIIQSVLREIGNYNNIKISVLPTFIIQRNHHVDVSKTLGWHRDCGGEFIYKYCTKKLCDKSYVLGKIGIYFQENGEFGGSIDLIPYSHRYFDPRTILIRKLKGIPLFITDKLHSHFRTIYRLLPEI